MFSLQNKANPYVMKTQGPVATHSGQLTPYQVKPDWGIWRNWVSNEDALNLAEKQCVFKNASSVNRCEGLGKAGRVVQGRGHLPGYYTQFEMDK